MLVGGIVPSFIALPCQEMMLGVIALFSFHACCPTVVLKEEVQPPCLDFLVRMLTSVKVSFDIIGEAYAGCFSSGERFPLRCR